MSGWRSDLKLSGYYYYDHCNDNRWYLISDFFENVMKIRPSTLINLRVPKSVYSLIISDLAHLAINDPYDHNSKEYAEYLLAFMEHPSKVYKRKYYFDYKAYTDDLIEWRIEEEKKAERFRIRKVGENIRKEILERKMKDRLERQIRALENSESESKRQELLKSKQERFDQILRKFVSEVKRSNSVDLKTFAMQNNFDLNEVLEIANLSELVGLTKIIDEKRTNESESTKNVVGVD